MTMAEMTEESLKDTFVVDSDRKALWAVKKIVEMEAERDQFVEFYKAQIEKIKAETQFHIDSMKARLEDYAATLPLKATKTQRSYSLPGAKLVFKNAKAVILHDDDKIMAALKAKGDTEFIKTVTVEKLDWAGLKKRFQEDGEAVDGISVEIEPESFEVKIEKEDGK